MELNISSLPKDKESLGTLLSLITSVRKSLRNSDFDPVKHFLTERLSDRDQRGRFLGTLHKFEQFVQRLDGIIIDPDTKEGIVVKVPMGYDVLHHPIHKEKVIGFVKVIEPKTPFKYNQGKGLKSTGPVIPVTSHKVKQDITLKHALEDYKQVPSNSVRMLLPLERANLALENAAIFSQRIYLDESLSRDTRDDADDVAISCYQLSRDMLRTPLQLNDGVVANESWVAAYSVAKTLMVLLPKLVMVLRKLDLRAKPKLSAARDHTADFLESTCTILKEFDSMVPN